MAKKTTASPKEDPKNLEQPGAADPNQPDPNQPGASDPGQPGGDAPKDPPPPPKGKKAKYACIHPVKHNGKRHTDTIELTEQEAEPLLAIGHIELK